VANRPREKSKVLVYDSKASFLQDWRYPTKIQPRSLSDVLVPYDPYILNSGVPFKDADKHWRMTDLPNIASDLPTEGLKIKNPSDPLDSLSISASNPTANARWISGRLTSILRHERVHKNSPPGETSMDSGGGVTFGTLPGP
jgi:hypothetical protein